MQDFRIAMVVAAIGMTLLCAAGPALNLVREIRARRKRCRREWDSLWQ